MTHVRKLFYNLQTFYNSEYSKFELVNPRFYLSKNDSLLSWYNYLPMESFENYEEYYQWVADNSQYSLAIGDEVFVQIYYEQIDKIISKASLAFIPNPSLYLTYFRFDMDRTNYKNYYHNSYHINFGYRSDDIRFSLNRYPYPSEFLKFAAFVTGKLAVESFDAKLFFDNLQVLGEEYCHLFDFHTDI